MKRWRIPGLVTAALVLFAWGTTALGLRADKLPDPLVGLTHHEWGIVLSGAAGASLGALVAVLALRRTILAQSSEVTRQLAAQSTEASRQRELTARAELLVAVEELIRIDHVPPAGARHDLCVKISNAIEKWRFELQHEEDRPLWTELDKWRPIFSELVGRVDAAARKRGELTALKIAAELLVLRGAGSQMMNAGVEFRRNFDGKNWNASEVARVLCKFRETSLAPLREQAPRDSGHE